MLRDNAQCRVRRRHRIRAWALAGVFAVASVSCSDSPSDPTPPGPTPGTNAPPVIQSVTVSAPRVEAEQEVQLTAVVQDAETPASQLTYAWSVSPSLGTLTGTGATARWKAPKPAATPDLYTFRLTVTERYTSGGTQRTNEASGSVQVHYNDSPVEITTITTIFLNEFSIDSVSAAQCVRNFSDSCPGKAEEQRNVQEVRDLFLSQSASVSVSSVVINGDHADIRAPCTFRSIRKSTGVLETSTGTCRLTAVYEAFRWWLCDSRFDPASGSAIVPYGLRGLRMAHP